MNDKIDLRIVKTHNKLTSALSEMMNEMPFSDITVFDLCEKAGVRRATFYKHFKDKYDFLKDVITNIIKEIEEKVNSIEYANTSIINYLVCFVNEIILYFEDRPLILANLLNSDNFPVMLNVISTCTHFALVESLHDVKQSGFNFTSDVKFCASFINGGISNILIMWLKNPTCTKEELLAKIRDILAKIFN